jgi:hypothetical protein
MKTLTLNLLNQTNAAQQRVERALLHVAANPKAL